MVVPSGPRGGPEVRLDALEREALLAALETLGQRLDVLTARLDAVPPDVLAALDQDQDVAPLTRHQLRAVRRWDAKAEAWRRELEQLVTHGKALAVALTALDDRIEGSEQEG
ncbi:MAG: hypothetical protein ACRDJN_20995 [Chloroflexota bacterium]